MTHYSQLDHHLLVFRPDRTYAVVRPGIGPIEKRIQNGLEPKQNVRSAWFAVKEYCGVECEFWTGDMKYYTSTRSLVQ